MQVIMASSASSNSRQHSNDASSFASSSSRQHSKDASSGASSSSRQHSNDASSCKQIELWCDHCAWLVKGQRFDDGKVCCAFCGKVLQDTTVTNNARRQVNVASRRASSSRAQGTGNCVNVASRRASSSGAQGTGKYVNVGSRRASSSRALQSDEFEKG